MSHLSFEQRFKLAFGKIGQERGRLCQEMVGRSRFLSLLFFIMKATSLHSPNWSQLRRGCFLIALGRRLALPLFFLGAALLVQPCAAAPFQWEYTGSLNTGRDEHTATLLSNGRVLVAGGYGARGYLASAELYDPATGMWGATGSMAQARTNHTATLLPNGTVLVAGGFVVPVDRVVASAELYDPATGNWTVTGSLNEAHDLHTATLLPNGKVLVAGGRGPSAELYDPDTGTWTYTGSLNTGRYLHTATLLPDGKVLVVAGGDGSGGFLASAELYDPATETWTYTGSLNTARNSQTATLLPDGMVLVAGGLGENGILASAELYDPATGNWTVTGSLNDAHDLDTATLLPNGQVLVAGGLGPSSAELYNPATGNWSFTGSLNTGRFHHTATLLTDGEVLVAGGTNGNYLASAELYDPGSGTPSLVSAASRLTHRSAGAFDIDMPLTGTPGVEDRSSGTYDAVFTFDAPVTSGEVTVLSGTATVGAITFSGNEMTAALTGVTDGQTAVLHTQNINGDGQPHGDVAFSFLIGDVDGNRRVAKPDGYQVKTDKNQVVNASNFRDDIDLSGVVYKPDFNSVKANLGHGL